MNKLNHHYKPFSASTYGETRVLVLNSILMEIKSELPLNGVFVDIGTGIGTLPLLVAALFNMTSFGIELERVPAGYAMEIGDSFRKKMATEGFTHSAFELRQGNILDDENVAILDVATIVYLNNIRFDDWLTLKLNEIFKTLKDGTIIISTKRLYPDRLKNRSIEVTAR